MTCRAKRAILCSIKSVKVQEHIIDKSDIYDDIEKRLRGINDITATGEGNLIVGIICQRIKDAMGMLRADKVRVYIPVSDVSSRYIKAKQMTHQQIAIEWFRNKEHWPWADLVDIEPTHIDWLLKTKAGVKL